MNLYNLYIDSLPKNKYNNINKGDSNNGTYETNIW